jgi:hypothetical protein
MARPIQATPVLKGEDAERLLDSLKDIASEEEIASRMKAAREFLARATKKPRAKKGKAGKADMKRSGSTKR